ncbi:MAG: DUF4867 family protein [Clostridiales bacterium]|nr:DUF4867 family protein [Clostridiales bacterium]
MKIVPVTDASFAPYGRVVEGYDLTGITEALKKTPCTDSVVYVGRDESLHAAPGADALGEGLYGGMPFQFGWCNGKNTKLNCLEYHRDSEFDMGAEDCIMLLAQQDEIIDGVLDTSKVKAFLAPAGVLVELYATTLHYAPCSAANGKEFHVLIALPDKTNTDFRPEGGANVMDKMLWARNKWLLAHPDSSEAAQGAVVALTGENIDISADI